MFMFEKRLIACLNTMRNLWLIILLHSPLPPPSLCEVVSGPAWFLYPDLVMENYDTEKQAQNTAKASGNSNYYNAESPQSNVQSYGQPGKTGEFLTPGNGKVNEKPRANSWIYEDPTPEERDYDEARQKKNVESNLRRLAEVNREKAEKNTRGNEQGRFELERQNVNLEAQTRRKNQDLTSLRSSRLDSGTEHEKQSYHPRRLELNPPAAAPPPESSALTSQYSRGYNPSRTSQNVLDLGAGRDRGSQNVFGKTKGYFTGLLGASEPMRLAPLLMGFSLMLVMVRVLILF